MPISEGDQRTCYYLNADGTATKAVDGKPSVTIPDLANAEPNVDLAGTVAGGLGVWSSTMDRGIEMATTLFFSMRFIRFITFIFYRYYSSGATQNVAYIKTVSSLVFFIYIHIFILLILVDRTDLLPTTSTDTKGSQYLKIALYTLPAFLFFFLFVKEKHLQVAEYEVRKVKRAATVLLVYLIAIVTLMITLLLMLYAKK